MNPRRYINSKKIFYDIELGQVVGEKSNHTVTLDSRLELEVFKTLAKHFDIPVIDVHCPAPIYDGCDACPQLSLKWKIDFRVPLNHTKPPLWIEVKGIFDGETRLKTLLLAKISPSIFKSLVFVHSDRAKPPKIYEQLAVKTVSLERFDRYLANLAA